MTLEEKLTLCCLYYTYNITYSKYRQIITVYDHFRDAIADNFRLINQNWAKKAQEKVLKQSDVDRFVENHMNENITPIFYGDEDYPGSFEAMSQPPFWFLYLGNVDCLKLSPKITVVGSRIYTSYGERVLIEIIRPYLNNQTVVVSGLALGVDGLSHRTALQNGTPTIAIIGSGMDDSSLYPQEHIGLRNEIVNQGGLIITTYPIGFEGTKYSFPERNRLLASLGDIVFVVQAKENSGSLLTSSYAFDLGKMVCTVPGSVFDIHSKGNNLLIDDSRTKVITNPSDFGHLLTSLNTQSFFYSADKDVSTQNRLNDHMNPSQKTIFEKILNGMEDINDLIDSTGLTMSELQTELTLMEIHGFVRSKGGNCWETL